jgi:diguanylate cyclase (GGDEF)-like protein
MDIVLEQRLELESLYDKIEKVSVTDELTGLLNRRGLMAQVDNVFSAYKRLIHDDNNNGTPESNLTCVILDIDHFKLINDDFGHLTGDKILIELGKVIKASDLFRATDIIGRYGGEEFMIILPGSNTDDALRPVKALFERIRSKKFVIDSGESINISVSIGVSQVAPDDRDFDSVFRRADQALYTAKSSGRDRIELN